ncbi:hypothetical protein [Jeongeupia sp. USM3]|uniref:hypothetical protein n=1 Tax=Jeongeupia sp. USM3 TaxID=1906741 RepID=UPI0011AB594C|nr:hypothetical protein [Jeongeupia sp. USM3]
MNKFVALLLFFISCTVHAGCEENLPKWGKKLQPGRTLSTQFASCRVWPAAPSLTLAVLPYLREHSDGFVEVYDLETLVVDTASGTIVAHLFQSSAITSDTVRLSSITMDTARYRLTQDRRAFGIRIAYIGQSRVNPYNPTSLNLYVFDGRKLSIVLAKLAVSVNGGEWDGNCRGAFYSIVRTIDSTSTTSHNYADLKINEEQKSVLATGTMDDCKEQASKKKRRQISVKFKNGLYDLPTQLRLD